MTPRYAIEGIWKSFGRRPVLRSASVWAYPGAVTAMFGRNGEGKSTLLRCGLGFVRPTAGVTILDTYRERHPRLARLARCGLFYLPDRDLLAATLTIRRQLAAMASVFPETEPDRVVEALPDAAMLDRRPYELSGGERRRAEIGFARARAPTVLVADEPLRGIAPRDAEILAADLVAFARAGCAVLVTGHETRALLDIADHVVWMTGGRTHHLGDRAAALAHDHFRWHYLAHF